LFDEFLVRKQHEKEMDVRFMEDQPIYNHTAYLVVVEPFLKQCTNQRKVWEILNFDEQDEKPFKTAKEAIAQVVSLMYPE
jgi:hypothetical protein